MKDITLTTAKQEMMCEYLLDAQKEWNELTNRTLNDRDFHMEGLALTAIEVTRYLLGIVYGGNVENSEKEVWMTKVFGKYESLLKKEEQE